MKFPRFLLLVVSLIVALTAAGTAVAATEPSAVPQKASGTIVLATTTSTQATGLLDVVLAAFTKATGIKVNFIRFSSGEASLSSTILTTCPSSVLTTRP